MEYDDNVSGEFQRSTRMPLDAVVRLHFQGTVAYQNGFAANVSASGMFVKHPAPPPLGTQLVFEFNLGAERKPVQGAGEVVWVREKYLGPGQPAGVGIRFLQLDSQSRDHIAEALFEYLEQSLTEDSLLDSSGDYFDQKPETGIPGSASPAPQAQGSFAEVGDIYDEPAEASSPQAEPPIEPIHFASLERLAPPSPQAEALAASPPADGKRAFSVFSPLDEADSETADIVRKALQEEPPLPFMAAAAAASSERQGSRAWLWLLILALVAGGGYLAWTPWGASWLAQRSASTSAGEPASSDPAPAPIARPAPLTAEPAPGTTLAETVGVDPNTISAASAPPHSAPPAAPPAQAAEAAEEADFAAQEGVASLPAAAAPTSMRAQLLTGIDWRPSGEAAGETVLVLVGDGHFATGTFSYSEIGGENPRVLIKLKGMQGPYRGPAPHGAGAMVRGVRTGFHVTPTGNEIHVVVDLARGGVQVLALEPQDAGLSLRLAP